MRKCNIFFGLSSDLLLKVELLVGCMENPTKPTNKPKSYKAEEADGWEPPIFFPWTPQFSTLLSPSGHHLGRVTGKVLSRILRGQT